MCCVCKIRTSLFQKAPETIQKQARVSQDNVNVASMMEISKRRKKRLRLDDPEKSLSQVQDGFVVIQLPQSNVRLSPSKTNARMSWKSYVRATNFQTFQRFPFTDGCRGIWTLSLLLIVRNEIIIEQHLNLAHNSLNKLRFCHFWTLFWLAWIETCFRWSRVKYKSKISCRSLQTAHKSQKL